ncbi:MAG: glycoside hydrolase family 172 protein [Verrucomicrobiota bacterium]
MYSILGMAGRAMAIGLLTFCGGAARAQSPADLFRITDASSRTLSGFHQVAVPTGGEVLLADVNGSGKVTYFYMTDDTVGKWNPGLILKVYWDDSKEPSIQVPLADFFGAIGGKSVDYHSAPMQINDHCFMCYLPMPFSKRATFALANDGDANYSQKVAYGVDFEESGSYATETSRLHCEWRRSNPVANGLHTILQAGGHGQYVGCMLQTVSRDLNVWFGEGDTIFHLDGRDFAHSPGTEDEYGSCWADPGWKTYSSPSCGHLLNKDGVNRMYRWYLANPVRFKNSLKVEIQNQHDNGNPTTADADDYTSVAFWYQEGPHKVTALPPFKQRTAAAFSSVK